MGIFDFLKKKELNTIEKLNSDLENCTKSKIEKEKALEKYSSIQNLEDEKTIISSQIEKQTVEFQELNEKYIKARETYEKLKNDISIFENNLELSEFGVYEPIYDFEKSDNFREEQNKIIAIQKLMIKEGTAAVCNTNWTIDGSLTKGKASTTKFIKLILRAFNGEADSLIAKVKWNNVNQIKERLKKGFITLNKLGEGQTVEISKSYFDLKMKELVLEYEYQAKKQQEKEELRALQEELREDEKARREYEKAQKDAEKEEAYYLKILEKVKKDFNEKNGNPEELQNKIIELEKELEEARLKKERALSMAQQTKRGHVYIISNIGSFGENVFKIGMTRRLEPMDRIKELGDASVPFRFDIHALIYSDEARTLEYELHKAFAEKALNLFNFRKEFFNVTLEEIENKIKELGFLAEFTSEPEAMEYKETIAIKNNLDIKLEERETLESKFPEFLI
ncbi:DUF4041 domain-containing protein [Chryseobacterium sp. GMJ5]|uniref:DUF4041 domain-containing protein n=1 Tax=Chryseobacterium gilvum TaxID=2976534 RepID=A0ABT2VVF0_9FLAO|nr:DUF4041 domain-containing protein [Chryseobacterium gilvum]MCU7613978.1 DUF4041 domain-containing protein [Chryseobacterium gilvum]